MLPDTENFGSAIRSARLNLEGKGEMVRIEKTTGFIVVFKPTGAVALKNGMVAGNIYSPNIKVYQCTLAEYEHVNGPLAEGYVWTPWEQTTTTITSIG